MGEDHYARSHSGMCIGFRTTHGDFSGALKVEYSEDLPVPDIDNEALGTNLRPLLSKPKDWAYENEFRLIAQERNQCVASETFITDNGDLKIYPSFIESIIIGCRAPRKTIDLIRKILSGTPVRPSLFQMKRNTQKFALTPERILY